MFAIVFAKSKLAVHSQQRIRKLETKQLIQKTNKLIKTNENETTHTYYQMNYKNETTHIYNQINYK